jgi:hypothetical protein
MGARTHTDLDLTNIFSSSSSYFTRRRNRRHHLAPENMVLEKEFSRKFA